VPGHSSAAETRLDEGLGGPARRNAETAHMLEKTSLEVILDHLCCIECGRTWVESNERWRIYLTDDAQPIPVLYCNVCAAFEFGR
jgi:hypothetical protein